MSDFGSIGAEVGTVIAQPPMWNVVVLNPDGNEFVLNLWQGVSITENFEGSTGTIAVPATELALSYVTELVSDVLYYRNNRLVFRHRVLNVDDNLTSEGHTVSIQTTSYEGLLGKRVLHDIYLTTADQHDMAWDQIVRTQRFQTLYLTRASPARSGRARRKISIERGTTVKDAINQLADVENGFDWWIDAQRRTFFQTPRRALLHGFEWRWGRQVAEIDVSLDMNDYASSLYMIGATSETSIPQGKNKPDKKYPPPKPVYLEVNPRPFGRWEQTESLSDVVTQASLAMKGRQLLPSVSRPRPSYVLNMEPITWDPAIRPGSLFYLRIESPPRLNIRALVRVEELSVSLSAAGGEEIRLSTRAEATPTRIAMPPAAGPVAPDSTPGYDDVDADILTDMQYGEASWGMTSTHKSISPVDDIARVIAGIRVEAARFGRGTATDDDVLPSANAPDDWVAVFYGFDGTYYWAGMWNPQWPGPWFVVLFDYAESPPPVALSQAQVLDLAGAVSVAQLTSAGVTSVVQQAPTTGTHPPSFYGADMIYSGVSTDPITSAYGAAFQLVTAGKTYQYQTPINIGTETPYPGMGGKLSLRRADGTWVEPSAPVAVAVGDALYLALYTVPDPPIEANPEDALDHATALTLTTLHADTYQLSARGATGAPVIVRGPASDLIVPLEGDATYIAAILPTLAAGTWTVHLTLYDGNGVQLADFPDSVTIT